VVRLVTQAWEKMSHARILAAFRGTGLLPGQSASVAQYRRMHQAVVIANAPDAIAAVASDASETQSAAVAASRFGGSSVDAYVRMQRADANRSSRALHTDTKNRPESKRGKLKVGFLMTSQQIQDATMQEELDKGAKNAKAAKNALEKDASKRQFWKEKLCMVRRQVEFALDRFRDQCPRSKRNTLAELEQTLELEHNVQLALVAKTAASVVHKMRKKKNCEFDQQVQKVADSVARLLSAFGDSYVPY